MLATPRRVGRDAPGVELWLTLLSFDAFPRSACLFARVEPQALHKPAIASEVSHSVQMRRCFDQRVSGCAHDETGSAENEVEVMVAWESCSKCGPCSIHRPIMTDCSTSASESALPAMRHTHLDPPKQRDVKTTNTQNKSNDARATVGS